MANDSSRIMQCMEVWGGSEVVDSSVAMAGIDAWVYSRPYQQAQGGGDVYYVSSCATGRITRLLVADVAGHGASVQTTAGALRDLMRKYVNQIDQRRFVRSMNRRFAQLSEGGSFATAVVMTFFGPTRQLSLCNAGHPSPLHYDASKKTWTLLEDETDAAAASAPPALRASESATVANIPLGVENLTDYEQFDLDLQTGDLVLCFSDSLIESYDEAGTMLGERGLLEIVRALDEIEPVQLRLKLIDRLARLNPKNLASDDVTILLFRASGERDRTRFLTRLAAPFRVGAAVIASLFPGGSPAPLPEISLLNLGGVWLHKLNRRRKKKLVH